MNKNKFLTFLFSTIPGCGHMYLGYLKRGAQFMIMFAASMYLAITLMNNLTFAGILFVLFLPVIWFYQMFDSMFIIMKMKKLEIAEPAQPLEDGFFFPGFLNPNGTDIFSFVNKRKIIKIIAWSFLGIGLYTLFTNITNAANNIILDYLGSWDISKSQYMNVYYTITNNLPPVIISLILIFAGIKLLKGKKPRTSGNNEEGEGDSK